MSFKSLTLTAFTFVLLAAPAFAQTETIPSTEGAEMPSATMDSPDAMTETPSVPTADPSTTMDAPVAPDTTTATPTDTTAPAADTTTTETAPAVPATTTAAPVEETAAPAEEEPTATAVKEEPAPVKKKVVVKKIPQDPSLAFMRLDTDGNGSISITEYGANDLSATALFNSIDADKDGMLSASEIQIYNNGPSR